MHWLPLTTLAALASAVSIDISVTPIMVTSVKSALSPSTLSSLTKHTSTWTTQSASDPETLVISTSLQSTSELEITSSTLTIAQQEYLNLSNITNYVREEEEGERDNSTDDCRFMSFEEWKRQKQLELEAEQSASQESILLETKEEFALTTLLRMPDPSDEAKVVPSAGTSTAEDIGRTYKDKFNYASRDCAATVVKTNSDAKGASAILTEVKDSYLLNQCSSPNKFVVIELCQDILVSLVVMGNFELFSSMFKEVRFSVSDRFPATNGWKELGQFEGKNIRDVQHFPIENPLIWARYLKVEILSHYGNEFYCPISLVRVHGTTMMEDVKSNEEVVEEPVAVPESVPHFSTENPLNLTTKFSDDAECRVVMPHLALNEFLKDYSSASDYCDVTLQSENFTTATVESTAVKTTQESILKNIVKRLSLLESNASLSLLYVEEQSKLLSDAFTNLERRHANRFDLLLRKFNETVHSQVKFLEHAIDSIKGESKSLFQSQTLSSNEKLSLLTREISFQRKVLIIDTIIILALLAYVIITRETFMTEELTKKSNEKRMRAIKEFPVHNRQHKLSKKRSRR